jgi:phosphoenolpyruvate carboxykinase (ATP)
MYHFLSGYTAVVAGTVKGVTEPTATFSTCFGHPFLPRHATVYGDLLRKLIAEHKVDCWLVNTGWTGGKPGVGKRMPIKVTRTLLTAALDGSLKNVQFRTDPYFGLSVPVSVPGVDSAILDPVKTWASEADFRKTAKGLVDMFAKNFVGFEQHVDKNVRDAAPAMKIAAE